MIKVLLVDDLALVRAGFRAVLRDEVDIVCVGECGSGEEALSQVRALKPDVLVCDLHLPGISGLEVTRRLVAAESPTRVLIVTVQEEGPLPRSLLQAGALGYVAKACEAPEFLRAIRDVARGRRYISADIAQRLAFAPLGDNEESPFAALSRRELEISGHFCAGRNNQETAGLLKLSPKTISTHKQRIFEKLGIRDVVALARLAQRYRVFEEPS